MNKSIKRTMGLVLALFVAVSMCVDISGVFADETNTNDQNTKVKAQEVNEDAQSNVKEQNNVEETKESEGDLEKSEETKDSKEKLEVSKETEAKSNAVAGDDSNSDEFYFEIIPEIFVNQDIEHKNPPRLFASPKETVGIRRSFDVYGGGLKPGSEVRDAWEKVAFKVYDESGNLLKTTTGTVGGHKRWSGAKYLGPYKKGHNYTVSVDASTLPKGYYSWITSEGGGHMPEDVIEVTDFKVAKYKNSYKNDFAAFRFHMDIMSFSFARNEEVAKDQFILDNDGKPTNRNAKWKNGSDYVVKPVSADGKLVAPTKEEIDKLADEGYRPNGFYAYSEDENGEFKAFGFDDYVIRRPGYSYLQWWNDNHGINTRDKFIRSSIYTLVLDQSIPKVTFDWNESGKDDPQNRTAFNVYYNKSLKNNSVSKDDKGLPKTLPKAPTKEGKVFAGWNTKPDGTGEVFTDDTVVTGDVTVYAQWKDKEYTITVDPNGGNWNGDTEIKAQQFKENEEFTLPEAPTKDGYTFLYWKGSQYQPGQVYVVKKDHKFTAEWKKNEVKPEPENPSDGKTPNPSGEGKTKAPSNNSTVTNKTPNTGDSTDIMLYAGLAALMSMGALLILKKKKKLQVKHKEKNYK